MNRNCSRRRFLQLAAAGSVLAPFAHTISLGRAQAAPLRRVLFVYVPDGCIPDLWHPTGSENDFSLPAMTSPLASIQQHLVFIDGLTMYSGGATHEGGMAKVLTGTGPQSLDIFLGEQVGGDTPFRSLQLGVGATFQDGAGSMSYIGPNQPVTPDDDPVNVFSRVFGGAPGGAGGSQSPERSSRKSILDNALGELGALQSRLDRTEREKLEVHLESIREVEKRLQGVTSGSIAGAACDLAGYDNRGFTNIETDYYPKTYHKEENFRLVGELQMDHAVLALSCGVTRVASLQWSHAVSPTHVLETGVGSGNHDASHYGDRNSPVAQDWVTLKQWFMDRFVYLVDRLAATPDVDGSLLDNTLVVLCSELGDSNLHDHNRVPFVLAGGAGGRLKTGRFLDFRGSNNGENEPHTKLLVSVAQMMGADIDTFGYAAHGTGPLPGLG